VAVGSGLRPRFRDPRDEDQLALDISGEPDLALLKRQLLDRVLSAGAIALSDLKPYTLLETFYRERTRPLRCVNSRRP
jgi:hypothetical protein